MDHSYEVPSSLEKMPIDTGERILLAAINLMAEKGYKAVTTKEIASVASVSEMTLFRHFGSKKRILEEAVDRFYYTMPMKKFFEEQIRWDLKEDLMRISRFYHELMKRNEKVILIAFKEGSSIPGLLDQINKHPRQLKEQLIQYFEKMQQMGKMIETDAEAQAMNFLYINYGRFVSRTFVAGTRITMLSDEEFIQSSVETFVRGITP